MQVIPYQFLISWMKTKSRWQWSPSHYLNLPRVKKKWTGKKKQKNRVNRVE
jgi:hypothetical protein